MAITEENREQLYARLEEVLGHAEATTMMEHLPPVGWADVATTRDLDALDTRMDQRFQLVDARFEMVELRFAAIDRRLDAIEERLGRLEAAVHQQLYRFLGAMSVLLTVFFTLDRVLGG